LALMGLIVSLTACQQANTTTSNAMAAFAVYCEMVANDAKPMALHYPMEAQQVNELWLQMEQVAAQYKVSAYPEADFPVTQLFPAAATQGKTVVLIYRGTRLEQYQQLKADVNAAAIGDAQTAEALARRFGRLLGYSPQGINGLLAKNTPYRNLDSGMVASQITHLYYADVPRATQFYASTLGLPRAKDQGSQGSQGTCFQVGLSAYIELHPHNEAHPAGQTKSTAIALLTDQLPQWYAHVQAQGVPIKYTYKPRQGGPHDGFVAVDPEGYLLEFEQFKQHPENELLMAILAQAPRFKTAVDSLSLYGSITWTYHNDVLRMQNFYDNVLGFPLVADQGWTKIYQTADFAFIGLVDERRGMEDYADTKGVELAWTLFNFERINAYATQYWQPNQYSNGTFTGPEKYIYHLKPQ